MHRNRTQNREEFRLTGESIDDMLSISNKKDESIKIKAK